MILLPREELFRAATFPVEVTARNSLGQVSSMRAADSAIGQVTSPKQTAAIGMVPPKADSHITPDVVLPHLSDKPDPAALTLIDWTPKQITDFPALHNLRPGVNQDQLA